MDISTAFPPVSLDLIRSGHHFDREVYNYNEFRDVLTAAGYKDYGWLNSGVKIPKLEWDNLYSSRSGSSCLYVNHQFMVMYSVDMGD